MEGFQWWVSLVVVTDMGNAQEIVDFVWAHPDGRVW